MQKYFVIVGFSLVIFVFQIKADVNQAIRMYIDTVEKIQSYDVTFDERWLFEEVEDPSNKGSLIWTNNINEVNRDIYVSGKGRKLIKEDAFIGEREYCLSWEDILLRAESRNGDLGLAMSHRNEYMESINPCSSISTKYSLTNLLQMNGVILKEISEKGASVVELDVYLNEKPEYPYAKVWLDCEHGGLATRVIEFTFIQKEKKTYPYSEIEITQFHKLSDGVWVPLNLTKYRHDFRYGELHREKQLSLSCDLQKCSWNNVPESVVNMTEGLRTEGEHPGWITSTTRREIIDMEKGKIKNETSKDKHSKIIPTVIILSILITPLVFSYYRGKRKGIEGN